MSDERGSFFVRWRTRALATLLCWAAVPSSVGRAAQGDGLVRSRPAAAVAADRAEGARTHAFRRLNGPWGGTVRALFVDAAEPNHLIAGTDGGIYHSYNGALSWVPRMQGLTAGYGVTHIRADPRDPAVMYATGSPNEFSFAGRVYKSVDHGHSWQDLGLSGTYQDIWAHETRPHRLLLGSRDALRLSDDGGATWTPVLTGHAVYEFAAHPLDPDRIYAAVHPGELAVSRDGGLTWEVRGAGQTSNYRSLAVSPAPPYWIYLGRRRNSVGEVMRTADEGQTFETTLTAPINRVRAAPTNPAVVWAVGGDNHFRVDIPTRVYRSADFGATWQDLTLSHGGMGFALAVDPRHDGVAYVGRLARAVVRRTLTGSEDRWSYMSATGVSELALHPTDERTLLASVPQHLTFRLDNPENRWQPVLSLPGWDSTFDYKADDGNVIVAGCGTNLFRSTDGGATFALVQSSGGSYYTRIRFSPAEPLRVYAGRSQMTDSYGVWASVDAGASFEHLAGFNVTRIEPDPFDGRTLMVLDYQVPGGTRLTRSFDGGATLEMIGGFNEYTVTIRADRTVPGRYYSVTEYSTVCRSDDWGESWTYGLGQEIAGHVTDFLSLPGGTLLALTDANGLWQSADAGTSWTEWPHDVFSHGLYSLAARVEDGADAVYLGTRFEGLWKWLPVDAEPPQATLGPPAAGTVLEPGRTYALTWQASDDEAVMYVDLFLSTDSGATWPTVIAGAQPNTGTFAWTVPALATEHARIRLVAYDPSWNETVAESTVDFTIAACTHSGDVNGDGQLTAADAQAAFLIALGVIEPVTAEACAADCNASGAITAGDAQGIFAAVLGLGQCADPLRPDEKAPAQILPRSSSRVTSPPNWAMSRPMARMSRFEKKLSAMPVGNMVGMAPRAYSSIQVLSAAR